MPAMRAFLRRPGRNLPGEPATGADGSSAAAALGGEAAAESTAGHQHAGAAAGRAAGHRASADGSAVDAAAATRHIHIDAPSAAVDIAAASAQSPAARSHVPGWLQAGAAWAWRLLLLALLAYVAARVAAALSVVLVPCAAALLLTALLRPVAGRLRRAGLPPLAAAWATLGVAIGGLAGVVALVTARVRAEYPSLVNQVKHTTTQIQSWLAGRPFHIHTGNLQKLSSDVVRYLSRHKSVVEGTVLTGGKIAFEVLGGVALMFFVTFFLLKDGGKIWHWLTSSMHGERKQRVDEAGSAAWQAVTYYVRGTVAVAATHAVVIGITLAVMNAPLVAPLAVLMFIAAFIPLVGMLAAGTLAILVVLAAKGWIDAVVLLGILVVMNQLESHLLQPLVVGKMVRLHPLAIILVLAVGAVVAGIAGAVVAVPIAAALTRAVPLLRGGKAS